MDSYLYAVRDAETGKLVSDITNPRRKYWDKKGNAESAVRSHMFGHKRKYKELYVCQFQLVPIGEWEVE